MKRPFIVVHDYQSGAVLGRLFSNLREDIEAVLPPPAWKVYELDVPGCPKIPDGFNVMESDIDEQESWLQEQIYIVQRHAEGKISFPVCGIHRGIVEYRHVWARSRGDIEKRFPTLQFLYGVVLTSKELDVMGNSDIDVRDDFIDRYEPEA